MGGLFSHFGESRNMLVILDYLSYFDHLGDSMNVSVILNVQGNFGFYLGCQGILQNLGF